MPKTPIAPTTPDYIKDKLVSMVTHAPAVALNYLAHATGITFVEVHDNLSLEQFHSPKARAKILTDYESSIKVKGLKKPVDELLKGVKAQLGEIRSKKTGLEDFKKEIEENEALSDAEKESKIKFCETREENLVDTRSVRFDLQDFQRRLEILSELLEKDQVDNPSVIVAYIDDEYHKMVAQIKADKNAALEQIEREFEPLKKAAALAPKGSSANMSAKELDVLQKGIEKRITDSYDKALTELDTLYEKGTPADKEKDKEKAAVPGLRETLVKTANQAEQELCNLVLYAEHTDSKALPASDDLTAGAGAAPGADPRRYRDIDFDTYLKAKPERATGWFSSDAWSDYLKFLSNQNHELYTPSGLKLNHIKNAAGETTGLAITLPANFELYHHMYDNQLGADLLTMMNEHVARGKDDVTITINIHNPELRQKIMEEAYIAAKLAGLSDDKIKFNVTCHEDDKQNISGKTATEIMGQLGQAPARVQKTQSSWDEQKKEIANPQKLRSDVGTLDRKITGILNKPPINAVAGELDEDAPSGAPTPFSITRKF